MIIARIVNSLRRNGVKETLRLLPVRISQQQSLLNFDFRRVSAVRQILRDVDIIPSNIKIIANYPLDDQLIRNHGESQRPICVSFGIYDDIQFESTIAEKYGATVFAFDPSPISRALFDVLGARTPIIYQPLGVWIEDGEAEFYEASSTDSAPSSRKEYSLVEARDGAQTLKMTVRKLETILNNLNLKEIDYLKMDIEGAVPDVLLKYLSSNSPILPTQLSFELELPNNSESAQFAAAVIACRKLLMQLQNDYHLFYMPKIDHYSQIIIFGKKRIPSNNF